MSYLVLKQRPDGAWDDLGESDKEDPRAAIGEKAKDQNTGGRYRAVATRFLTDESLSFRTETKMVWGDAGGDQLQIPDAEAPTTIVDERDPAPEPDPA